jgi:hypothetical protein
MPYLLGNKSGQGSRARAYLPYQRIESVRRGKVALYMILMSNFPTQHL